MAKRKSISLVLSVVLLLSVIFAGGVSADSTSKKLTEWFNGTDKTVAQNVASTLGVSADATVSATELQQIQVLYITAENGVTTVDLAGIENLTGIDTLVLQSDSAVQYTNADKLQQITSMRKLTIGFQTIDKDHFVKDLTQLNALELNGGEIKDNVLGALSQNLRDLRINGVGNFDLEYIDNLRTTLSTLHLNWLDGIKNFTNLSTYTNLWELVIQDTELTDANLAIIGQIEQLRHLTLVNNNLKQENLHRLSGQTELETLYIARNNVNDLTPFKDMTKVKNLVLSENNITDISLLANMPSLEWVHLFDNHITDVSPLKNATNMQTLNIGANQIKDISSLKGLVNMENFSFDRNEIEDIGIVKNFTKLQMMSGIQNKIEDVSALKDLNSLYAVYLDSNRIYDISTIEALLQRAYFSGKDQEIVLPQVEKSGKSFVTTNKIVGADGKPVAIENHNIYPGGTYDSGENTLTFTPFEHDTNVSYTFNSLSGEFTGVVTQDVRKIYIITFDGQGGTVEKESATAKTDEKIAQPKTPVREGYDFIGWNTKADGAGHKWDFANDGVTSDMTLYAQWAKSKQPEDNKPSDNTQDNKTQNNNEKTETEDSVQTGDQADYMFFVVLLVLSGATLTVGLRKKKRTNRVR